MTLPGKRDHLPHSMKAPMRDMPSDVDPLHAIMIGDRSHDIIGARNNGMIAVAVLYGYGSKEELVDAGAHQVCATPQRLLPMKGSPSGLEGSNHRAREIR